MANGRHIMHFEELNGVRPNETADILIGVVLILVVITGIGGNIPAVIYFWKKRKKNIPKLLYTIISLTDVCLSAVTIVVIPVLFNNRRPTLFTSYGICVVFALHFNHLQQFSMFMVMMLSASHTVAIFAPFYKIRKRDVIISCLAFEIFWIVFDIVFLGSGILQTVYYAPAAVCGFIPGEGTEIWTWKLYIIFFLLWLVLGTLVVFVSFIMSLRKVAVMRRNTIQNANQEKFVDVSVTITLFTATFLMCNLPQLLLQTWANIIYFTGTEDYFAKNSAYSWYGLVIAHVFLTTFNAASNPCLYLTRMLKYRAWLRSKLSLWWAKSSTRVSNIE